MNCTCNTDISNITRYISGFYQTNKIYYLLHTKTEMINYNEWAKFKSSLSSITQVFGNRLQRNALKKTSNVTKTTETI